CRGSQNRAVLRTAAKKPFQQPLPPAPSPKRRGGAEGKSLVFLPSPHRGGAGGGVAEIVPKRGRPPGGEPNRGHDRCRSRDFGRRRHKRRRAPRTSRAAPAAVAGP